MLIIVTTSKSNMKFNPKDYNMKIRPCDGPLPETSVSYLIIYYYNK